MVTPQIVEYIKKTIAQGYAEDKIKDALTKKGWSVKDVEDAFRIARGLPPQSGASVPQESVARPTEERPAFSVSPQATPAQPLPTQRPIPISQEPAQPTQPSATPRQTPPAIPAYMKEAEKEKPPAVAQVSAAIQEAITEGAGLSSRSRLLYVLAGSIVVLIGAYVFVGARYGIYVFGINLFPFEKAAQKIGLASVPSPTPSIPLRTPSPTPTQTPTLSPIPQKPHVSGREVMVYGDDREAGTVAALAYNTNMTKAAYILLADGGDLLVMDIAGGGRENLSEDSRTLLPNGVTPVTVSWSPGSATELAVVGKDATGIRNLYRIDLAAKTVTRLTQFQTPDESIATDVAAAPKWSPDGTKLLVLAGGILRVVPKDGTAQTPVTPALPFGSFAWSPDGSSITYTIRRLPEENVWVMDSDGRNFRQLTFGGENQMPQFSPGGTHILYFSYDDAQKRSTVFGIKKDGTEVKQIASISGEVREAQWSTGGSRVAFLARTEDGKQSLWMARSDGSGLEEVLPKGEYEPAGFISWSAEGDKLYTAGFRHFLLEVSLTVNDLRNQTPAP